MKSKSALKILSVALAASALMSAQPAAIFAADAGKDAPKDAKQCPLKGGKHRGDHKRFAEQLGLTDAQKEQMKAAKKAFREENAAAFQSMKSKHEQYKQLVQSGGKDSPAAVALHQQLRQDRQALHAKMKTSFGSILTPEQQAKLEAMKAEHKANKQNRCPMKK